MATVSSGSSPHVLPDEASFAIACIFLVDIAPEARVVLGTSKRSVRSICRTAFVVGCPALAWLYGWLPVHIAALQYERVVSLFAPLAIVAATLACSACRLEPRL